MMNELGYAIGVLTSILCAVLLIRAFLKERTPLLLWCSLCFVGLALNNVLLFLDKVVYAEQDQFLGGYFVLWRSGTAALGIGLLVYGLVWDSE